MLFRYGVSTVVYLPLMPFLRFLFPFISLTLVLNCDQCAPLENISLAIESIRPPRQVISPILLMIALFADHIRIHVAIHRLISSNVGMRKLHVLLANRLFVRQIKVNPWRESRN
jgi:hypothetical protein